MFSGLAGKTRRIGILVMVVALALQPAVGGALAAPDDDGFAGDACGRSAQEVFVDVVVEQDLNKSERCESAKFADMKNSTLADLYASGLAQNDFNKSTVATIQNRLEDSRSIARMEAKAAAVRAFKNGSNLSTAESRVNDTVESYYVTMQKNLAESHKTQVNQYWYIQTALNQSGLAKDDINHNQTLHDADGSYGPLETSKFAAGSYNELALDSSANYYPKQDTLNLTFVDGTTEEYPVISFHQHSDDTYKSMMQGFYEQGSTAAPRDVGPYTLSAFVHNPEYLADGETVTTSQPYNESNNVKIYEEATYIRTNLKIQSQTKSVKKNATQYTRDLYATYSSPSDLNVTEVLSPIEMARGYNTNLNSTGAYGWLAAEYGLTTLEGDVNSSFYIEYTPRANHTRTETLSMNGSGNVSYGFVSGESYNMSGTLFADASSATFKPNETYDTSNFTGVVFVEQVNSNASRAVELNGTFKVVSLTDPKTGESLNKTSLTDQSYSTWNASSTREEMKVLIEYRDNVTDNYETSGSGGGGFSWPNFNFGAAALGFIAILGGAFVLILGKE